jgi:hypothetical protein
VNTTPTPTPTPTAPSPTKHPLAIRSAQAVLGLVILVAVVNTIRTRTAADFIQYTLLIYVPLALFLGLSVFFGGPPSGQSLRERFAELGFLLLGLIVITPVIYSAGAFLKDAYLWIQSPSLSRTQAIIVGGAVTATLGGGLFYFRLRLRSIYGFSEAIVGIVVATQRIATESDAVIKQPAFYLAILTAGIYLVVRGLDNVHQGLKKDPFDPLAIWLVRRFNLASLFKIDP